MNAEGKELVPIKVLHDFVDRIERLGVEYMLTGSMAMMSYSVYRYTADVDVVVELNIRDATRIIAAFEPDYFVPHNSVRRAISSERMFNIIHQATAFKVDCIIRKSSDFQKNVFIRRRKVDFYGREIFIITIEDLILSKLWWANDSHSDKQLTDVKNLMRAGYDADYVRSWTDKLELTKLFNECLLEITA